MWKVNIKGRIMKSVFSQENPQNVSKIYRGDYNLPIFYCNNFFLKICAPPQTQEKYNKK